MPGTGLNKNKLAEIDEFEAQQKELEGADRVIDTPVAAQHQPVVMQRQGAILHATRKDSRGSADSVH